MGYNKLIQRALDGIEQAKAKTAVQPPGQPRLIFPITISVGLSGTAPITSDGVAALRELGRLWHSNDSKLRAVLSRKAAQEQAVLAFGELLEARPRLPADVDLKTELLRFLDKRMEIRTRTEHFYFAVRAFEGSDIGKIAVGPVVFFRREEWLDEMERNAGAPFSWKETVLTAWRNNGSAQGVTDADDIIRFVGTCDSIASISISGRDRSRSTECAKTAVIVALDSLGLEMSRRQGRNLRGPGDNLERKMDRRISQFDGHGFNGGTSVDLPRIGGPPGWQADYLRDTSELRAAVGVAIDAFVDLQSTAHPPRLMRRWNEAMYWFGQSRREDNDFIALVKVGIAMDVLAKGGKSRGITALVCALHDMKEDDILISDQVTLGRFVKTLYDDGRSKIAHGGELALLNELPLEVALADDFASKVLIGYVMCAAQYNGPDNYEDFLAAAPSLRKK